MLEPGKTIRHESDPERGQWIQMLKGKLKINEKVVKEGDGASIEGQSFLHLETDQRAAFLLFDLA